LSFAPKFCKKNEYIGHFTPASAKVLVPPRNDNKRQVGGWDCNYQGWKPDTFDEGTYVRTGAKKGNLKPSSHRGALDEVLLKGHGLTKERVDTDPLLFFQLQLLFPIADPIKSGSGVKETIKCHTSAMSHNAPMSILDLKEEDLMSDISLRM
jgi:hypothetical protein